MTRILAPAALAAAFVLAFAAGAAAQEAASADPAERAKASQERAEDTRAQVVAVAEELESSSGEASRDAKGQIEDAKRWLARGDTELEKGEAKLGSGEPAAARQDFEMAYQYYVKAATAGLNARRMITGD